MNAVKKIHFTLVVLGLLLLISMGAPVLGDELQWQGTIAAGGYGAFPPTGFYAASDSFPRNTVVTVENLHNGKTASVIIVDRLSTPRLFMTVSAEAATELGLSSDSIVQARVTMADDGKEYAGSYTDLAKSRDPDINPSASFMDGDEMDFLESVLNAKGMDSTASADAEPTEFEQTPIAAEESGYIDSTAENRPLSVEEMRGIASTTPEIDEVQSDLALAIPERVGAVPEMPDDINDIAGVYGVDVMVPADSFVSMVTKAVPLPPENVTDTAFEIASMYAEYADSGVEPSGIDSHVSGVTAFLPEPSPKPAQSAERATSPSGTSREYLRGYYEFASLQPNRATIDDALITTPDAPEDLEIWPRLSGSRITPKPEVNHLAFVYMPVPEAVAGDASGAFPALPLAQAGSGTKIDTGLITMPTPPEMPVKEPRIADAPVSGDAGGEIESEMVITPTPPDLSEAKPERETDETAIETPDIAVVSPLDGVVTEKSEDIGAVPEIPEDAVIVLEPAEERPPEGPPDVLSPTETPAGTPKQETPVPTVAMRGSTAEPASDSIRITEALARGSHYLQVGTFSEEKSARSIASRLIGDYPMTMYVDEGSAKRYFRIMVGPLTPDESGVVLLNLRSEGFSDAFVRKIE